MPEIEAAAATRQPKYIVSLLLRCPKTLAAAITRGADQSMTSKSSYIRHAIVKQLARDGIRLRAPANQPRARRRPAPPDPVRGDI